MSAILLTELPYPADKFLYFFIQPVKSCPCQRRKEDTQNHRVDPQTLFRVRFRARGSLRSRRIPIRKHRRHIPFLFRSFLALRGIKKSPYMIFCDINTTETIFCQEVSIKMLGKIPQGPFSAVNQVQIAPFIRIVSDDQAQSTYQSTSLILTFAVTSSTPSATLTRLRLPVNSLLTPRG